MNSEPVAGPSTAEGSGGPAPRDLRRELAYAMRKCTPKQRQWLKNLPKHNFQLWGEARASLGISPNSVRKWLRQERIQKVRALLEEIAVDDLDISNRRILSEYARIAFADIRALFDDEGRLLDPSEWSDEIAAAVDGVDTQERQLKDEHGNRINEWELVRKVRTHNKLAALEFLATFKKLAGAKRLELTGLDGSPLQAPAPVVHFVERAD